MKVINKIACPTTKLDVLGLRKFKYSCLEKDALMPLFLPLADENFCDDMVLFINILCNLYNSDRKHSGTITDWTGRPDGAVEITVQYDDGVVQDEVLGIPSNLATLIAYYHIIGRHRKAAMLCKTYKKLM